MKLAKNQSRDNIEQSGLYDYYIAMDWSIETVSIARMKSNSQAAKIEDMKADIRTIKTYLKSLKGKKIMTIEETTGSNWLYVELKDSVNRLIICDPYRNSLLSEGPKTDRIDAGKLCQLLRAGLLKEVYHSQEEDYKIRTLVSSYEDVVKAGVRVTNQMSAIYRSMGMKVKGNSLPNDKVYNFIANIYSQSIKLYNEQKETYDLVFKELKKTKPEIRYLCTIPGIAETNATKIFSRVIDAGRFATKYKYWSYAGLVKYQKESGNRNYGQKNPRYSRMLKGVYKIGAMTAIGGKSDIREYYEYLLKEKSLSDKEAQNQVARYIATSSLAVMKHKLPYKPYQWREERKDIK